MIPIYGQVVDQETRCVHYHSTKDIIAIKFKCCGKYYPCYQCHQAEGHKISVWKKEEFDHKVILCGVCKTEFTIRQYQQMDKCTCCGSMFNEGCKLHHHLYFE